MVTAYPLLVGLVGSEPDMARIIADPVAPASNPRKAEEVFTALVLNVQTIGSVFLLSIVEKGDANFDKVPITYVLPALTLPEVVLTDNLNEFPLIVETPGKGVAVVPEVQVISGVPPGEIMPRSK
jgi:hypothetical protein